MYYYVDQNGRQQGPFSVSSLMQKGITGETLVWKAGMEDWTQAKFVPELSAIFATPPAPPMPPGYKPAPLQTGDGPQLSMRKPDSNMVWAVFSTICCCLPAGLYAVYCSIQVDSLYKQGDYTGAVESARKARDWAVIGAVCGAIFNFIYAFFLILSQL